MNDAVTDEMLIAKAKHLDDECLLTCSGKQCSWLTDILSNWDEGKRSLSPNSRKFLTTIYSDFYTDTTGEE